MNRAQGVAALSPLRNTGLQEEIYSALRRAITEGTLAPGERLRELDLARQFGTSQTPIREALRRLGQDGLVISLPRRGTFVTRLSPQEIADAYALRAELESWAVRRFIERASAAEIDALRMHLEAMKDAAHDADPVGSIDADLRFHAGICAGSGSSLLIQLWTTVDSQMRGTMATAKAIHARDLRHLAESHLPILRAIEQRDALAAEAAIRDHLARAWKQIQGKLEGVVNPAEEHRTLR